MVAGDVGDVFGDTDCGSGNLVADRCQALGRTGGPIGDALGEGRDGVAQDPRSTGRPGTSIPKDSVSPVAAFLHAAHKGSPPDENFA